MSQSLSETELALDLSEVRLAKRLASTNLGVPPGQCVLIVGPNGSGKSSLLRCIAGLEPAREGSVKVFGRTMNSRLELAAHVGWLPQRPAIAEGLTTEELVATARFRFGESEERSISQARRTMEETGCGDLQDRRSDQISGGELQRVLLSMLVAQQTPILLVDEPANHLDPQHQVASYRRLGRLWRDQGRTLLVVTHDVRLGRLLGPLGKIRVLGMGAGAVVFDQPMDAPDLSVRLTALYGVPFIPEGNTGGLGVDLDELEEDDDIPLSETRPPPKASPGGAT